MVLLAFLTYRIYRHYTNKGATATEPASPPKSRSHSGPVTPKTCSHSGPVLAYPGVSYSRLPRPMATLKHAAPMVVDAQRCPALPARASIVVKSMPTQLVAAPATIMGVRLSKESFTAVSEACACGITSVARVFSCSHSTRLLPASCVCWLPHSRLAQQHSAPTIWVLAAGTSSPDAVDMLPTLHGPYPDTGCCDATLISCLFVCRLRLRR